jgi:hypothetical protein
MSIEDLISGFTPSKIIIQTSVLPLISIDPTKKSWLGDLIDPKIYAVISGQVYKIDPKAGSFSLSSQAELDALPNNWGNIIVLTVAVIFLIAIIKKLRK